MHFSVFPFFWCGHFRSACSCLCVCVTEGDREGERKSLCVCVCLCGMGGRYFPITALLPPHCSGKLFATLHD